MLTGLIMTISLLWNGIILKCEDFKSVSKSSIVLVDSFNHIYMDPEEILELIEEGTIGPDDIEDFRNLDPEIQDLVESGEIDMDEARDLN